MEPSSIALEHAITTARYMTSILSVSHPSSCRVGKCQEVEGFSLSLRVFRSSEKVFRAAFSWLPSVSFDQVRMLSHEQSCGECFFVESFFKHSVNRLFLLSLVGAKIVGWELDPSSCVEIDSEVSLCFVFMFVLWRLSVVESVTARVCSDRL